MSSPVFPTSSRFYQKNLNYQKEDISNRQNPDSRQKLHDNFSNLVLDECKLVVTPYSVECPPPPEETLDISEEKNNEASAANNVLDYYPLPSTSREIIPSFSVQKQPAKKKNYYLRFLEENKKLKEDKIYLQKKLKEEKKQSRDALKVVGERIEMLNQENKILKEENARLNKLNCEEIYESL